MDFYGFAYKKMLISQEITKIDVDWLAGDVRIICGDGLETEIAEEANRALLEGEEMRWSVDGGTLRIRFAQAEPRNYPNLQKRLTVLVPRGNLLESLRAEAVSANIWVDADAANIRISAVSGNVRIGEATVGTAKINTVSGEIDFESTWIAESFSCKTVSGNLRIAVKSAPLGKMRSTSGSCTLKIPKDSRCTCKCSTVSGKITTDFADNSGNARYLCSTVSGDIKIEAIS